MQLVQGRAVCESQTYCVAAKHYFLLDPFHYHWNLPFLLHYFQDTHPSQSSLFIARPDHLLLIHCQSHLH